MAWQIDIDQKIDHVGGNFEWEKKPKCSCGKLIQAIDEYKFIFVSNFTDGKGDDEHNVFYMLPVDADGSLVRSKGVTIQNCPWCGDPIQGRKKYSTT
jgi:hypothetical protein